MEQYNDFNIANKMGKKIYTRIYLAFYILFGCTIVIFFNSCQNEEESKLRYFAFRLTEDGKWGMMNTDGDILFQDLFSNIPQELPGADCFAVANDSARSIDIYTIEKNPKKIYGGCCQIGHYSDGLIPIVENYLWPKFIDKKGQVIIDLREIDGKAVQKVASFHNHRARFMTDGKWGYIDTDGDVVTSAIFDFASDFNNDRASVSIDGKWGVINQKGSWIIKPTYDNIDFYGNDYIVAFTGGKHSETGSWNDEECRNNHYYRTDESSKWSVINNKGKILLTMKSSECILSWSESHFDNRLVVYKDGIRYYLYMNGDMRVANWEPEVPAVSNENTNKVNTPIPLDEKYKNSNNRNFILKGKLYYLTDKDGKQLSKGFSAHMNCYAADFKTNNVLASDYVDIIKEIGNLRLTDHSIDDIQIGVTPSLEGTEIPVGVEWHGGTVTTSYLRKTYSYLNDLSKNEGCIGILLSYKGGDQKTIYSELSEKVANMKFVSQRMDYNEIRTLTQWFHKGSNIGGTLSYNSKDGINRIVLGNTYDEVFLYLFSNEAFKQFIQKIESERKHYSGPGITKSISNGVVTFTINTNLDFNSKQINIAPSNHSIPAYVLSDSNSQTEISK